jgi:hypothetical protein
MDRSRVEVGVEDEADRAASEAAAAVPGVATRLAVLVPGASAAAALATAATTPAATMGTKKGKPALLLKEFIIFPFPDPEIRHKNSQFANPAAVRKVRKTAAKKKIRKLFM